MYQTIIENCKPEMDKALQFFQGELAKIRTGQASPALVEDVQVTIAGQKMPLKQLAGISTPERRQLLIQPWDHSYLEPIEKALQQSSLGTSPIIEKNVIRVHLPQLTQEYRDQLVKVLGEKSEDARKVIRKVREDAWEEVQEKTKKGEIREDDKFRAKEDLQKLIDEYNKKIEEFSDRKRNEVETV